MKKVAKIRILVLLIPITIFTVGMVTQNTKIDSKKETIKTEITQKYYKSYYRRVNGFKK